MQEPDVYHVETVETAATPRGSVEGGWCRYVVASQRSRIVGRFHGTLAQTRRNAEHLVKNLNSRLQSGKTPWTPRSQGAKKKASPKQRALAS